MALDENNTKLMNDLKVRRRVIKSSLTRVKTFIDNFQIDNQALSELEFRQEQMPQIYKNYDEVQCQIELIAEDFIKEDEDRDKFETDYFAIRSQIQEIVSANKVINPSFLNNSSVSHSTMSQVKLAPVILPEFSGNIQEWEAFFNVFMAMVHNDKNRPTAEKFFHLRSCLKADALDLVKSVPLTDANYSVVVERLKKRYDNKALVIQSHIRSILDIPKIQKPSAKELQNLHSHVSTHLSALKALDQPIDQWDAWLITIVVSRLDTNTVHEWQLRQVDTELPAYNQLEEFLSSRCIAFETSEAWDLGSMLKDQHQGTGSKRSNQEIKGKRVTVATGVTDSYICPYCKGAHKIFACNAFRKLKNNERVNIVRENRLCFNCLSSFHLSNACTSNSLCNRCNRKHNTLLHFENGQANKNIDDKTDSKNADHQTASTSDSDNPIIATPVIFGASHAFLATASVNIMNDKGVSCRCRAVLDSGSMVNFISKGLQNKLQLSGKRVVLPVSGIGKKTTQATTQVVIQMCSRLSQFKVELACYVLPSIISDLPSYTMPVERWNLMEDMIPQLADPLFNQAGPVDILIGGGIFFELMEIGRIPLGIGSLSLQESKLGWIVTGETGVTCLMSLGEELEEDWIISQDNKKEAYGKFSRSNQKSLEEEQALKHFVDTAKRDKSGRFVLQLPLKNEVDLLGETLTMATSRFLSVERRLQQDEDLRSNYVNFMDEYLQMGHMEEVNKSVQTSERVFYLPHHPVLKLSSLTTKLRVVFDASAKSSSGLALNDVLMCGPTVQEELFAILVRFRQHQYVIIADIEKMFRQVKIREEDRDLQRIVWRSKPSEQLRTYRLSTVTYGTTSASFMTTNCLVALAEQFKDQYPIASTAIRRDFYMDDLMTGADTIEKCCELQKQIHAILETAKFPLRKWCSNSHIILEGIGTVDNDPLFTLSIGFEDIIKSLGLRWKPSMDEFSFQVETNVDRSKVTKRMLLSDLNRVFDPLGFLTPVLILGKIFLQQLWQLKIEWDKPLTEELKQKWEEYYSQLKELSILSIPRKSIPFLSAEIEIHGFCDASQQAYGAAIYVVSKDLNGQRHSRLLCSKSRVAPLKNITIPRLELNGALILTQLSVKVADAWEIDVKSFHLWTDSMIVLGWLNSQPNRLKTYVANRVNQITDVTDIEQWNHVKTEDNPADVVSRGLKPQNLVDSKIWWYGPSWLIKEQDYWNEISNPIEEINELPEQKPLKLALIVTKSDSPWLLECYSDWAALVRLTAYIYRFINNSKIAKENSYKRIKGPLTTAELTRSKYYWIKQSQKRVFADELAALVSNKSVHRNSCLKTLNPFLDDFGVIRVGGKLAYAPISSAKKYPIVLPSKCKVTNLIFEMEHKRLLHIGPQGLLANIQTCFWPIRGRNIARKIVNRCITCFRAKPKMLEQFMAPLPKERVTKDRVFAKCGVDFCGPFMIRSGIRRVTPIKHYVALFVCMVTRAIHLELVRDLSADAFLSAFFRFISRRGQCTKLFSDNGTNFVGANRILKTWLKTSLDDSKVSSKLAEMGIEWNFIAPASPHFGDLWESGVKSAKYHLTRTMKSALLNYEEMVTLLCRIEAVLNSRPMTPLSSDPSDYEALTPGHFLIGGPITAPPEPDSSDLPLNRLQNFKLIQSRLQIFWKRWTTEYLPQMQRRGKWTSVSRNIAVGDLALLQDDSLPPIKWNLVRVVKLHPGADNIVRVVTVRNSSGQELKRPAVKIALLPTFEDEQ